MKDISWSELLIDAVKTPGKLSAAYSAFWEYSIGNQVAALWQCHSRQIQPGPLSTYKGWQAKGRQVRKGEKALWLCMPVTPKAEENGEEHVWTSFIWRPNWFVLPQTDGADVPAPVAPEWDAEKALTALEVSDKTRFHELAHIVLGHTSEGGLSDSDVTPRNLREVEAESVAYILCSIMELPGIESSRAYIQGWLASDAIPEKSAAKIMSAADKILKAGRVSPLPASAED